MHAFTAHCTLCVSTFVWSYRQCHEYTWIYGNSRSENHLQCKSEQSTNSVMHAVTYSSISIYTCTRTHTHMHAHTCTCTHTASSIAKIYIAQYKITTAQLWNTSKILLKSISSSSLLGHTSHFLSRNTWTHTLSKNNVLWYSMCH